MEPYSHHIWWILRNLFFPYKALTNFINSSCLNQISFTILLKYFMSGFEGSSPRVISKKGLLLWRGFKNNEGRRVMGCAQWGFRKHEQRSQLYSMRFKNGKRKKVITRVFKETSLLIPGHGHGIHAVSLVV